MWVTYAHTYTHTQMQILLVPLSGHVHQTKQACQCKQTLGAGKSGELTTPLSLWVWAPEVPPGPVADT